MKEELQPAIDALKKDLEELEREAIETKNTINRLCKKAGMPPLYSDVGTLSQASVASIKPDTFYGKSVITATREYLEMRKAANLGPATAREVFEALRDGGFAFQSKVETNSIAIVRQAMSKQASVFHRLPNGSYGLLKWYPKAKAQKSHSQSSSGEAVDENDSDTIETDDSHLEESPVS